MEQTKFLSVGVKSFLRPEKLEACLESLSKHQWQEVIIADDGPTDEQKEELFNHYAKKLPLTVLRLSYDVGVSAGRNTIADHCQTEYLLLLDDDQTVPGNIGILKDVLDEDGDLGGVSCLWHEYGKEKCGASNLRFYRDTLVKEFTQHDQKQHCNHLTSSGYSYRKFDFIPNSTLFRTNCLKEFPWDSVHKSGREHVDFYLTHKLANKWQFAVCLDVQINHFPEKDNGEYAKFRKGDRVKQSEQYLKKKFGIREMVNGPQYMGNVGGQLYYHRFRSRIWSSFKQIFSSKNYSFSDKYEFLVTLKKIFVYQLSMRLGVLRMTNVGKNFYLN